MAAALIVLASALVLPADAAASRASGNDRTFAVGAAQTSSLGTIVVDSQPTTADVRLDGVDAGFSTPATFSGVTPGAHQVSVTIPGFQPWQQTVSVTAGATTTLNVPLLVALPATIDAEVTVTTTSDAIDGDTSSIAALMADPGPDGAISLREAITAANATAGNKVIRFAPALQGAVITPGDVTGRPFPTITGGDTWIIGDIDGDGAPDVTIDGRLAYGISIWSSGVVVSGLRIVNNSGVALGSPSDWTGSGKTLADDRLLGNSVDGESGLTAGPLGFLSGGDPGPISNLTWSGLIYAGNQLSGGGIAAYPGEGCATNNHFTDLTIASNTVTDSATAIVLGASDTNTTWQGVPGPTRYADNDTLQGVTIEHNRCRGILYPAIHIYTADMGGSDCAISDVVIRDNDIVFTSQWGIGIMADAAELASAAGERACAGDSLTHVEMSRNQIQGGMKGILVCAGNYTDSTASVDAGGASDDVVSDVVVADNQIRDASDYGIEAAAGTAVLGASPCLNTTLSGLVVSGNLLANATTGGVGIRLAGGLGGQSAQVTGNQLTGASLTDNTVQGFAQGIWISGGDGTGAVENALTGSSSGNSVSATEPWLVAADSDGASGNTLSFAAAELTPTITSFTPASGPPGTAVIVTGTGLAFVDGVSFNGVAATGFSVDSDVQITATVPAGATSGPIIVTTPGSTVVSSLRFTVLHPTLTSFAPQSGRLRDLVTLVGTGFTGATTVKFNGHAASFAVTGDTLITASVPFGATSGPITMTSPEGSISSAASFKVLATTAKLSLTVSGLAHGGLRLGRRLTMKAALSPANLAGGKITFTMQHKRSGKWRTVSASVRSTSSSGRCDLGCKPGSRGAYRVRVTIGHTSTNTAATTTWHYFTVS